MNETERLKDYQKRLEACLNENQQRFETKITYLSVGVLSLSMIFIEKIVPLQNATEKWTLVLAWVLLACSLLINLISYQLSASFCKSDKGAITSLIKLHNRNASEEEIEAKEKEFNGATHRHSIISDAINWFSLALLFLGILSILAFVYLNI